MRRLLIALVVAGGLLLGPVAPATTSTTGPDRGEPLPQRNLHDTMVKDRGRLFFQGRVDPGHGPVIVQKKKCSSKKCPWRTYRTVQTRGEQDRWKVRVYAPRQGSWYWRGHVKAYGGYAKSWTAKWRTYLR